MKAAFSFHSHFCLSLFLLLSGTGVAPGPLGNRLQENEFGVHLCLGQRGLFTLFAVMV